MWFSPFCAPLTLGPRAGDLRPRFPPGELAELLRPLLSSEIPGQITLRRADPHSGLSCRAAGIGILRAGRPGAGLGPLVGHRFKPPPWGSFPQISMVIPPGLTGGVAYFLHNVETSGLPCAVLYTAMLQAMRHRYLIIREVPSIA